MQRSPVEWPGRLPVSPIRRFALNDLACQTEMGATEKSESPWLQHRGVNGRHGPGDRRGVCVTFTLLSLGRGERKMKGPKGHPGKEGKAQAERAFRARAYKTRVGLTIPTVGRIARRGWGGISCGETRKILAGASPRRGKPSDEAQ